MTITKAQYMAQMTQDRFLHDYREIIAHLSEVVEGITSYLQLNHAEELIALSRTPDARLYRTLLAEALITLIDRGALTPIADLNDLAQADLAKLRRETGIGAETLPPPPPKPPTADELLRHEIANDWRTLPMDKVRAKKNGSKLYAAMLEKMANEGTLDSVATSLQRAGG
jgi:hypothetical protein